MKIIRFLGDDNRTLLADQREDGRAELLDDLTGIMEPGRTSFVREHLRGRAAIVADDDENMSRMMAAILQKFGCRCIVARDGAEAIALLERNPVDLIVSDIQMPHRNGYEIYSSAKELHPGIPVVLVTGFGYDPSHSLVRAEEEGLSSVLYKPFTPEELLREVEHAVRQSFRSADALLGPSGNLRSPGALVAPLSPRSIIGIGRNYRSRANESLNDAEDFEMFLKPPGSVTGPSAAIHTPRFPGAPDPHLHAEAELALVVGLRMHRTPPEDALRHVLGATIAIDVTALRFQNMPGSPRWFRGKGFDTFCPIGPAIVTLDGFPLAPETEIRTRVNGEVTRRGHIGSMLRSPAEILSLISQFSTIEPGTIVLTGGPPLLDASPNDPAPLRPGDAITAEIDGLDDLHARVE